MFKEEYKHSNHIKTTKDGKRANMMGFSDLEEVVEALITQSDWNAEDGVGGVLIETRLTVSSKQSQSPAPSHAEHWFKLIH